MEEAFTPRRGVAVSAHSSATAMIPLHRIYVLEFADETDPEGIFPTSSVEAMKLLVQSLRLRPWHLSIGDRQATFEKLATYRKQSRFIDSFDLLIVRACRIGSCVWRPHSICLTTKQSPEDAKGKHLFKNRIHKG